MIKVFLLIYASWICFNILFTYFKQIKTPGDVYIWLNKTVFPSLFPEFDLNGDRFHWRERQFMNGIHSLRLGPPRLRQMRVTQGRPSKIQNSFF